MLTFLRVVTFVSLIGLFVRSGAAQDAEVFIENGEAISIELTSPSNVKRVIQAPGGQPVVPPGQPVPGQPNPGQPKKPGEEGKPDAKDKKGEEKKPESKFIVRPDKPEKPADPRELLVQPGTDGKMSVSFAGQSWPDVLRWLKRVSRTSLDWNELPKGYINLVTSRRYTVDEIRNILNRHLLARGFTILVDGEMMSVRKTGDLNSALVPRLHEDELDKRHDYEFVRVSFALKSMLASDAVEELGPLKSPNGKLAALTRTNRLEAMDAVINLRQMRDVIREEQSGEDDKRLVRPFVLKYVKAEDVVNQLKGLLGDAVNQGGGGPGGAMNPQQMQQMMQQMQQAAQQAAKGGKKPGGPNKVFLVANVRDNEILVNAPPDKMALIEEAILILDKKPGSNSLLSSITETEVYRLASLNPETFLTILDELGGVSPRAKIQVDKAKRALIVSGSRADHIMIEMLVQKLDGSNRRFHVIPLRKHEADYVAGSVRFMMGTEAKKQENTQRRSFFFGGFGSRNQEEEDNTDKFRIDADVEYNRLLLWCNDLELEQIRNLLVELGEISDPRGNPNRRRAFRVDSLEEAHDLIRRLEKVWPSRGENKLDIDPLPELPKEDTRPIPPSSPDQLDTTPRAGKSPGNPALPVKENAEPTAALDSSLFRLLEVSRRQKSDNSETEKPDPSRVPESKSATEPEVTSAPEDGEPAVETTESAETESDDQARLRAIIEQLRKSQEAQSSTGDPQASSKGAPIRVRVSPSGEIFLESDDTRALDMIEEILDEYAPPHRDWKVFQLKYPNTWALGIELTLKEIFEEEIKAGEKSTMEWDPYWGIRPGKSKDSGPRRLSARKPLKIISDRDTHTILVQGATRDQMKTIEELISVYDRPQSTEPHAIRRTRIFQLKYTQAPIIAEAIKDVYRDLLSQNDRALQNKGDEKDKRPDTGGVTYIYGGGGGGDGDEGGEESRISFKGQLSIGVDKVSNILIVSAAGGLLENISQIVEQLDEAAKPNSAVQVIKVDSRVNPRLLQEKLHKIFGPKPPQQNPNQKGKQNNNGQPANQQNPQVLLSE